MRILVLRKSGGLGDVVCCEPAVRGLRKRYEDAELTFRIPREYASLFKGRDDANYVGTPPVRFSTHWVKRYKDDYDVLVDLCGPESHDERAGSPECSRIESFCSYAGVEATCPKVVLTREERKRARKELSGYASPWIGLGVNGKQWTKNWPNERWGELSRRLPGTKFYLDASRNPEFDSCVAIVGKELRTVAAMLSQLDLLITVDTGLLHLAAAVGAKTLSIWSSTDPVRTLKHYEDAYYVDPRQSRLEVGCAGPCLHRPVRCGTDTDPYSRCMRALGVETVLEHATRALGGEARRELPKGVYRDSSGGIPKKGTMQRVVFAAKRLLPATGGAERTAVEMLKALGSAGNDVVAIWTHSETGAHMQAEVEDDGKVTWAKTPASILGVKLRETEPDLVVTQLEAAAKVAKAVPKTTPLFLYLHSVAEHFCDGSCGRGDVAECEGCENETFLKNRDVLMCADVVLANSEATARVFKKFTGKDAVLQYPVPEVARCATEKTAETYCVAIGVTEARGSEFLAKLARVMPEEQFLWVDSEADDVPDNVEVMHPQEDLRGVFDKAFLNLTPHEGFQAFGRTPVEAGHAGVPTLTLANGGLPEAVGDGGLVLKKDVSKWAGAIRGLREDRGSWERLSEAAKGHARGFSWGRLEAEVEKYAKRPVAGVKEPTVTVVIPTYNRAELLPKAADSALAQKHSPLEVVIVDDGSTDGTKEIVEKRYGGDARVRYVWKENGNTATALNRGIKEAKGEYICWLSSDDFFLDPMKTKKQLTRFERHGNDSLRLVHSDWESHWTGDGAEWSGVKGQVTPHRIKRYESREARYQAMVGECVINGSTCMFDARLFREVGLFNPCYRYCQDYDMWLRVVRKYDVELVQEILGGRHEHKDVLGKEVLGTTEGRALWEKEKELVYKAARMLEPERPTICAEICMKNEEDMIERTLDDVTQWADKIVVLDDGSTDGSVEIVRKYPKVVDVCQRPDKGNERSEGKDRQRLLEMAQSTGCEWVVFIDSDETFENAMKWNVYDLVTDEAMNLYYFLQVNLWRNETHYRTDELWYKGWFGRLFRSLPELEMTTKHDEHCGGIPCNIPGAPTWPVEGSANARKVEEARVRHYGFVDWRRAVQKSLRRYQRDPYRVEDGVERGGFMFYDRVVDMTGMELREYEGDSVADYMARGQV